jgi:hypothetical protein
MIRVLEEIDRNTEFYEMSETAYQQNGSISGKTVEI